MTSPPSARGRRLLVAAVAVSLVSAAASSIALRQLNVALLHRHLPNASAGEMGQGFPATGLEGGVTVARETLATWAAYAAHHSGLSGRAIAFVWLAVDAAFLAILGYGLLVLAIYAVMTGRIEVAWFARRRATCAGRAVRVAAVLGLLLVAVDLVENLMAAVVIASDASLLAEVLKVWGRGKWALAGVVIVLGVGGLTALAVSRQDGVATNPSVPPAS
jgi:hypothetical protein